MISAGASRVERAEVEAVLLRIVADAVGFAPEEIDPDAHFLEIGASSLALVDAFRAVHETFGVRPSVREVFDRHASLRSLGDYVLELIESQPAAARPTPVAQRAPDDGAPERRSVPLSPAQRRVGFLARYSEGASAAYNEVAALRLRGSLDRQALESALSQAVARHEALRASLRLDQDVQEIRAALPLSLPVVEVTPDRAGAWLLEESDRRFDFGAPLFRASLLRLAADVQVLAVTSHELVADQQALMLLLGETATLYRGERVAQRYCRSRCSSASTWRSPLASRPPRRTRKRRSTGARSFPMPSPRSSCPPTMLDPRSRIIVAAAWWCLSRLPWSRSSSAGPADTRPASSEPSSRPGPSSSIA
jgi:acyl carrier protein